MKWKFTSQGGGVGSRLVSFSIGRKKDLFKNTKKLSLFPFKFECTEWKFPFIFHLFCFDIFPNYYDDTNDMTAKMQHHMQKCRSYLHFCLHKLQSKVGDIKY